jgi:hypothetical protein
VGNDKREMVSYHKRPIDIFIVIFDLMCMMKKKMQKKMIEGG